MVLEYIRALLVNLDYRKKCHFFLPLRGMLARERVSVVLYGNSGNCEVPTRSAEQNLKQQSTTWHASHVIFGCTRS